MATKAIAQNGNPTIPSVLLQSNRGPVIRGPMERARQLNDADAPLIAERSSGVGDVLVILASITKKQVVA